MVAVFVLSPHIKEFIASFRASILKEEELTNIQNSKVIFDLGAPSANMYKMQGKDLSICSMSSA
ncbi:MAG: hypothetical protein R2774_08875 [Saprospiraceae bacterium]